MADRLKRTQPQDDGDARSSNDAWDGVKQAESGFDEDFEDLKMARRLQQQAAAIQPNAAFSARLRENIMNASTSPSVTAKQSRLHWLPKIQRARAAGNPPQRRGSGIRSRVGAFATIALVALTLAGIFVFNRQDGGPEFNAGQLKPGPISSAVSPTSCPASQTSYEFTSTVSVATFQGSISNDAASAKNWQMQGWKIAANATTTFSQPGPSVAVDFVLDGFYSAIFGSSAAVARHGEMGAGGTITIVKPGDSVDLNYGDAVSFDPSKRVTITNASHAIELDFKRALFTVDGPDKTPALVDGAMVHIDASGTIPSIIGTIGAEETDLIRLDYAVPSSKVSCDKPGRLNEPAGAMTNPTGVAESGYVLTLGYNEG